MEAAVKDILHFDPPESYFEEGADFVKQITGISIAVSEEKAVDSYNQSFECNLTMTDAQAIQLRDWLLLYYPIGVTP